MSLSPLCFDIMSSTPCHFDINIASANSMSTHHHHDQQLTSSVNPTLTSPRFDFAFHQRPTARHLHTTSSPHIIASTRHRFNTSTSHSTFILFFFDHPTTPLQHHISSTPPSSAQAPSLELCKSCLSPCHFHLLTTSSLRLRSSLALAASCIGWFDWFDWVVRWNTLSLLNLSLVVGLCSVSVQETVPAL